MLIPAHSSKNMVYVNQKIEELGDSIREKLGIPRPEQSIGEKILSQFVDKFGQLSTTDQYKILTSMPEDESRENIQNLFGVSERKARCAKQIQEQNGVFSTPNPKPGKRVSESVIQKVHQFYENDTISRQMPGKKDFVNVKINGKKTKIQKRQIYSTIYETYLAFQEKTLTLKLDFPNLLSLDKNILCSQVPQEHIMYVSAPITKIQN